MPNVPDPPWIQEAERCGGFPDSPQEGEKELITWKYCERCADVTLHKFEGEDGECLKCENKKGDNHK